MPWFKDGAHDRVFNSCLNGAVSLTDSSRYLDEIFTDDENILFYDLNMLRDYEAFGYNPEITEPMVRRIKELLQDNDRLQQIADNAYMICRDTHCWDNVAEELADIL